ncbi:sulfite exporter TauE/SafE family protein [Sporomusa termitida]|uniref:Probable membrane transporter protein n=1 Tax=Sporomusa termitida TaxID=2377 RepID=A0A517DR33_9FIRM|nr:sulfite exporter TauE/SafE family protein [Sporomusa termitida]QDR79726.1 Sulfite exporter TauE/SafE [Sporomusa termitida]
MHPGWPGLILLGYLIGIITGLFGIGGGFLLTPSLKIIFHVSYPVAIGSSLLQIFCTSLFSAYKHWQHKKLDTKMGALTAAGSLIGAEGGVRLLRFFTAQQPVALGGQSVLLADLIISLGFLMFLLPTAVFMYREACASRQRGTDEPQSELWNCIKNCQWPPLAAFEQSHILSLSIWMPILLSLSVGLLTGLLGIGGGFISFPLLVYCLGMPTKTAVGTSTLQVLAASGYGAFRYIQAGNVDFLLVLLMLLGSTLGVRTGVRLSRRINACDTRTYFSGLLVVAVLLIVYDLLKCFIR